MIPMITRYQKIALKLMSKGYTQVSLAKVMKRSQPWVFDLLHGRMKDIKSADADKLNRLNKKLPAEPEVVVDNVV